MIKQEAHAIKGIQRDLTVSKFNSEFAFDAQNIRITARDHNTLLSITNEKGNKEIILKDKNNSVVTLQGTVIGYNVLNNYLTLFTTDNTTDRIYRLERKGSYFECITLYTGSLNFNTSYPIESIGVYENENIQKVYWIDGRNQARVINITASDEVKLDWNDGSFDFVQELNLNETITVSRNDDSNGAFASGVIQYAFTYYNMYGQESNIFYTTPLQYISFSSRGASPEEKVSNSFTITIKNPDPRFDYIRIYSIHRTSIDATPTVLNVVDIAVNGTDDLIYVDNGSTGTTVDPTELLYVGGESIVPQTMAHKDNTLFLGNILLNNKVVGGELRENVATMYIGFGSKYIDSSSAKGYYSYKNHLSKGSNILSFHSNEYYRFGLQFQYKTGKWSEPVFIRDAKVNYYPSVNWGVYGSDSIQGVQASTSMSQEIIKLAVSQGFVRVRGVVVYPSATDREVVAQGILCPTVYNLSDRFTNSPYAQASWFSRPYLGVDIANADSMYSDRDYVPGKVLIENDEGENRGAVYVTYQGQTLVSKGVWAEFRHNYPIPSNWHRNAEIQCIANAPSEPYATGVENMNSWIADRSEFFFIDQSIVTMHSPEFEFDDAVANFDTSSLKLRIVGRVPFTANASDIDIQTSTPQNKTYKRGFYKEFVGVENVSAFGSRSLISGGFYFDKPYNYQVKDAGGDDWTFPFYIYPWHRNGSLNNQSTLVDNETTRTAMLSQKKMSNLKFAAYTEYFSNPWNAYVEGDNNHTGISGVAIFNSEEQSLVRLPAPSHSGLGDINYYGNIDKVIAPSRVDDRYWVQDEELNRKNGYPIIIGEWGNDSENAHVMSIGGPHPLQLARDSGGKTASSTNYGVDPVSMKYKSTPHAVIAFNYTSDRKQVILPATTWGYTGTIVNKVDKVLGNAKMPWDDSCIGVYQDVIRFTSGSDLNGFGFLWLAELYNDNVENRFGGNTPEALENNIWLPAGEPISLIDGYDTDGSPIPKNYLSVTYTEGDTYFQRYDCLKTYPYTMEDQNSVVEIMSFYCETRVNIDGRYDRNRGQTSNLIMTPTNFNLINPVYSQRNNFFSSRALNYNKYSLDYFPNTITWTKEKQAGAIVDTWTNITMASTLDLDGDKGEVVSLNTFNNEVFCFQKQGFSNILFNSRVQIPTSDGMPIEISNGLKVDGKRYISNTIGCNNKWSIVEAPSGLYFIDNITNSIYLFNGQIGSLSDKLGFRQWTSENNSLEKWDPVGFKNFVTYYDKNNGDVYFVNNETALVYSELLGQFTSFMSYGQVPAMFNINSDFYAIQYGKVWEQFAGDYNMFFGHYYPYSVTFVSNADEPYDKIFNTVEFRADCWTKDNSGNEVLASGHTFDTLEVWNEYQKGVSSLTNLAARPSPLKKKFRVWRANVPRANTDWNGVKANKMDRIRNTWAYVKLSMNKENTDRMEFHDMIIHYFV